DFLDQVVTSTLVMEGDGHIGEYVGGYSDWLRQRPAPQTAAAPVEKPKSEPAQPAQTAPAPVPKKKLSYKEQRELEQLPGRIEALETQLAEMAANLNNVAFYQQAPSEITAYNERMTAMQAELDAA